MLIDTHAHLNFNAFKDDADEVIRRSLDNGVWMINVGSQYETSKRAVDIAEKYPNGVYAAVGLHPIHGWDEQFSIDEYRKLARSKKVVAIGECGLDYFHKPLDENVQRTGLCTQLELARELNLPVIFHCRSAHADLLEILKSKIKNQKSKIQGVIHCFAGTWEDAQKYLEMGFYLGFNGIIFKLDLDEVIKKTPLERILLETDCPYLTPLPAVALAKAGPQPIRNEPIYIKYIAEKIAGLKGETFEKLAEITTENAKELFKI